MVRVDTNSVRVPVVRPLCSLRKTGTHQNLRSIVAASVITTGAVCPAGSVNMSDHIHNFHRAESWYGFLCTPCGLLISDEALSDPALPRDIRELLEVDINWALDKYPDLLYARPESLMQIAGRRMGKQFYHDEYARSFDIGDMVEVTRVGDTERRFVSRRHLQEMPDHRLDSLRYSTWGIDTKGDPH